jgi:hypothetical protein
MDAQARGKPGISFAAMAVSALLLSACLAGIFEWEHYRRLLRWADLHTRLWERGFFFWLLCGKTLWLLAPLVIVAQLLRYGNRPRTATLLFACGLPLLSVFLVADLRCQQICGNHLLWLLSFVRSDRPQEWLGAATILDSGSLVLIASLILGSGGGIFACHWLTKRLSRRRPARAGNMVVAGTLAFAAAGVLAGPLLGQGPAWTMLARALPVPAAWFDWRQRTANANDSSNTFNHAVCETYRQLQPGIALGQPVDDAARVDGHGDGAPALPNIIIIVLESFRADALDPRWMPQLCRWAQQGLRLERHYAGSNCSHHGIFSLLYGRTPLVYDLTVAAGTPPQMPRTFRNSGYRCSYLSYGMHFWSMNTFLNERHFDQVVLHQDGPSIERDRLILRGDIEGILRQGNKRPQLIFAFLLSSHFNYQFPKEYAKFRPVTENFNIAQPNYSRERDKLQNRYHNALFFLDDEIANLLGKLDLSRNIVVVTGDHGESFWEDGVFLHSSKGSDVQTHVPLVIAGPGVRQGALDDMTRHADVLPSLLHLAAGKPVPLRWTHGNDIFAAGFHSSAVVLHPGEGMLLLRDQRRLRVRIRLDRPEISADGFWDVTDHLIVDENMSAAEEPDWEHITISELRRLAP